MHYQPYKNAPLKATQGPHCCMFNFRTAENSSRGRDIWREVPGMGLAMFEEDWIFYIIAWPVYYPKFLFGWCIIHCVTGMVSTHHHLYPGFFCLNPPESALDAGE